MKNFTKYYFALFAIVFLLNGCQRDISAVPPTSQEKQDQHEVIEGCLALNKTNADVKFAYLDGQFNNVEKNGWYSISDVDKDQNIYRGLTQWTSEEAKEVVLENTTPSGDWYRIDEYCFNKDGNIAELYSDLRTSYSDVDDIQVIRTWKYYSDGSVESSNTELFDLKTKNPINPDDGSYMDNPPKLVRNYAELAQYLGLPEG